MTAHSHFAATDRSLAEKMIAPSSSNCIRAPGRVNVCRLMWSTFWILLRTGDIEVSHQQDPSYARGIAGEWGIRVKEKRPRGVLRLSGA